MNAGLLRADVNADVSRPEIRRHQNAGLLLAVRLGHQEIELVTASAELAGINL